MTEWKPAMPRQSARDAVLQVMKTQPTLTWRGFENPSTSDFLDCRTKMETDYFAVEFAFAAEWLGLHRKLKRATINSLRSYFLKHAVERWCGKYISNGALIAAAFFLGYPIKPCGDLNAHVGVKLSRD
jgi:hypothetical protein